MRISQLTLATADVARQSAFWSETLGLPVRDAAGGAIEVALQSSTIRFEQAAPGMEPRYHFAVSVPRGSIEDAAAWIGERHELLAFHGDPDEEEGATIVRTDSGAPALYFLDGAGNVAELIANSPSATGAPFGAGSLLAIAEIGVATADPDATVAAIREALAAEIHWGGREGWLLTAIGDDDGVVIVAPAGRGWIPVGLPAHPWPTTIVVAAPRHVDVTLPEGPYRIRSI